MSAFVSNSVVLTYGTTSRTFTALMAEDDSFDLTILRKPRLDWGENEVIQGYKTVYSVLLGPLDSNDITFLYAFACSASTLYVTINGTAHIVKLRSPDVIDRLMGNFILAPSAMLEFADDTMTRPAVPVRAYTTTYSQGDRAVNSNGTRVLLQYNYGPGTVGRWFTVDSVNSYILARQKYSASFIDYQSEDIVLGRRQRFQIQFGPLGLQSPTAQQDDRDWIREFCLAPSKTISVLGQYSGTVINDFTQVRYSMPYGTIHAKAVSLAWIERDLNVVPPTGSGVFVLDQSTLDTGVLG